MTWRTKAGSAATVEHATRDAADARIAELRSRYRAGATRVRIVRLYDPEGGVRLVDFAAEVNDARRALHDVELATAARDRAVAEARSRWEAAVRQAVELGQPIDDVAAAAGVPVREVRAILRRN